MQVTPEGLVSLWSNGGTQGDGVWDRSGGPRKVGDTGEEGVLSREGGA